MVGRPLSKNLPEDRKVNDVGVAYASAVMRTAELVTLPQERRRPRQGLTEYSEAEAELQATTNAMHAVWQRLKTDTRDAQLRRAVRHACKRLNKV